MERPLAPWRLRTAGAGASRPAPRHQLLGDRRLGMPPAKPLRPRPPLHNDLAVFRARAPLVQKPLPHQRRSVVMEDHPQPSPPAGRADPRRASKPRLHFASQHAEKRSRLQSSTFGFSTRARAIATPLLLAAGEAGGASRFSTRIQRGSAQPPQALRAGRGPSAAGRARPWIQHDQANRFAPTAMRGLRQGEWSEHHLDLAPGPLSPPRQRKGAQVSWPCIAHAPHRRATDGTRPAPPVEGASCQQRKCPHNPPTVRPLVQAQADPIGRPMRQRTLQGR